ncbi:MAG: hypothetical protein ACOX7K_07345 [Oscillospiraceae bacterium]|jgi:hypothetical protein
MARPFSPTDAKRILERHHKTIEKLNSAEASVEKYRSRVKEALENKVDEMISLIRILQPGIASQVQGMAFMSAAPQFRKAVAPVYYRRKREDVLTDFLISLKAK